MQMNFCTSTRQLKSILTVLFCLSVSLPGAEKKPNIGLEKLTQLTSLNLYNNPALTKAQIDELKEALPNCKITHNARK